MTPETKLRELERRAMDGLTVPSLLASRGLGIDGVVNGIETQHGQVHVEWWCDGPPGWRVLTEEVERLRLDLDAAVLANS